MSTLGDIHAAAVASLVGKTLAGDRVFTETSDFLAEEVFPSLLVVPVEEDPEMVEAGAPGYDLAYRFAVLCYVATTGSPLTSLLTMHGQVKDALKANRTLGGLVDDVFYEGADWPLPEELAELPYGGMGMIFHARYMDY